MRPGALTWYYMLVCEEGAVVSVSCRELLLQLSSTVVLLNLEQGSDVRLWLRRCADE